MAASWLRPTLLLLLLCVLSSNAGKSPSASSSAAPAAASSEVSARAAPEPSPVKESKADDKEVDHPEFRSAASAAATEDGASATTATGKEGKALSQAGGNGGAVANAQGSSGGGGGGGGVGAPGVTGGVPKDRFIGVPLPAYPAPFYNLGYPQYPQPFPQPYPYGYGSLGLRYPGLYSPVDPGLGILPPNPVFRDVPTARIDDGDIKSSDEAAPVYVKLLPFVPAPPVLFNPYPVNPYQFRVNPNLGANVNPYLQNQLRVNPYLGPPNRSFKYYSPKVNRIPYRNLPYQRYNKVPQTYPVQQPVAQNYNKVYKPKYAYF